MSILTVDPGINVGWCYFRLAKSMPQVLRTGSLNGAKHGKCWEARAEGVVQDFRHVLAELNPAQVWLEQPEAISSTSSLSGSQFKLDAVFGMLVGVCICYKTPWFGIRIRDWKGQLPKEISTQRTKVTMQLNHGFSAVEARKRGVLPQWYPQSEHSWDALGLAVYVNKLRGKVRRELL